MQISFNTSPIFKRQLFPSEEAEFFDVMQKAKQKLGNNGHSILVLPISSLPQGVNENTGVGNLLDKESEKFFDFAKQYWGINCIQTLPNGRPPDYTKGEFKPYAGTNFTLGEQTINIEALTKENFGKILNKNDVKELVNFNNLPNKETHINYENILNHDSKFNEKLKHAFEELKKADTQKKKELLKEFETYKTLNKEWLEPMSIYESLSLKYKNNDYKSWNHFDQNLYNTDIINLRQRKNAIEKIKKSEYGKEIDFYKFKQYIAEKQLEQGRALLNKKGIKLSGDMCCGFSKSEVWANPKAFIKDSTIGWKLPALNLETKEGEELIKKKVRIYAKRYDNLRIDASWTYISPKIENEITGNISHKNYGDKFLNIIDDEIKSIKGEKFNKSDIMHEFVADLKTFDIYENGRLKPYVETRNKIYTTDYMHKDWATVENFNKRGWEKEFYVLGSTNHDSKPMKLEFAEKSGRIKQTEALAETLKIPSEKIKTLDSFIKAKFADPMRAKHNMIFFIDALSLDEQYKESGNAKKDYRIKISHNYKENYFKTLEKGEGFNVMDALDKAFIAEGLDKSESELYNKIIKYKKILQESTEKSKYAKGFKTAGLAGIGLGVVAGALGVIWKNYFAQQKNKIKTN